MKLLEYIDKTLIITADNDRVFVGHADDYFNSDDNDNGKESIVLTTDIGIYEFYEEDIKSIEIIA